MPHGIDGTWYNFCLLAGWVAAVSTLRTLARMGGIPLDVQHRRTSFGNSPNFLYGCRLAVNYHEQSERVMRRTTSIFARGGLIAAAAVCIWTMGGPPAVGQQENAGLNESRCVKQVVKDNGQRYLKNSCPVPVSIAWCSLGPVNDYQNCKPLKSGNLGVTYAITSINSLAVGAEASNTSVVAAENEIPFFACANEDGKVHAFLTSVRPPGGTCIQY